MKQRSEQGLDKALSQFASRAKELKDSGELDRLENDYKYEVAHNLAEARKALFSGSDRWVGLVDKGLSSNLTVFVHRKRVADWIADATMDASAALRVIWTEDALPVEERIRAFCDRLPKGYDLDGRGTRTNIASVLLMGLEVERYPPFRITLANKVYKLTGFDPPLMQAD